MNWLLILIVGIFAYYMWKKYNGRGWKYVLGISLVLVGILFIEFTPDPISVGIYSLVNDVDLSSINSGNLANALWEFEIWSITVGIILLFVGVYLLDWKWKNIWKKLNLDKFGVALGIGFLIIILIAYLDIKGLIFFTDLGRDYTTGDFPESYWIAFRNTAYILMGLVAVCYWFFVKKDKSETLAVFLFPFIMFWFGLSDIFYFVLRKLPIPSNLPWMDNHIIIGNISKLLQFNGVTSTSLLITAGLGIAIALVTAKILKDKF